MTLDPATREAIDQLVIQNSILVARDIIVDMYTGMERFLKLAGGLLYNISKRAGKLMAQRLKEAGLLDENNYLDVLAYSFVRAGYAEKVEYERSEGKVVFRVQGSLLGSRIGRRKKPVDQPIAGFIAGWMEEVLGKRVDVKETRCTACGAPYCVFEAYVRS